MVGVMAHGRTTHPAAPARRRGWLEPSPATLAVAVVVLGGADWGSQIAGDSLVPGGPLDEIAHLLTTLLVLWALGYRARRFLVPALVTSIAIDVDHVPARLGADWLTVGTPRPYTHSLLAIAVVLACAALWPRRRDVLLGMTIGLAIHFGRDMAEGASGVSLLWPLSYHPFQYSHGIYLGVMAAFVLIDTTLCVRSMRAGDLRARGPARAAVRTREEPRRRLSLRRENADEYPAAHPDGDRLVGSSGCN